MSALDRLFGRLAPTLDLPGLTTDPDAARAARASAAPGRLWIAEVATAEVEEGPLHLAVVLDACSRRCLGRATAERAEPTVVRTALRMALGRRWPHLPAADHRPAGGAPVALTLGAGCQSVGLHNDRGAALHAADQVLVERFFAYLNADLLAGRSRRLRAEIAIAISRWIEDYYNPSVAPRPRGTLAEELRGYGR